MPEFEQEQRQEGRSQEQTTPDQPAQAEMCCDSKQTAEQHRHDSPDGKCCIDK